MKLEKKSHTLKSWGSIPVGSTLVPVRWIVLWLGFAGWLGMTLISTGPEGITAFAFNMSLLIGLILISCFTRSVPLRTVFMMFFAGGGAMGLALLIEKIFLIGFLVPARSTLVPFIEELVKLAPIAYFLWRTRRFSQYTFGLTDMLIIGAAVGAGFGVVNDAFLHESRQWHHQIQWLPTADLVHSSFLVVGHAVWTALVSVMLGIALLLRQRKQIAAVIAVAGFAWVVYDHYASLNFNSINAFVANSVRLFTARGNVSVFLFLAAVAGSVLFDAWMIMRWSLKASQFRLPKRREMSEGLAGLWDFLLDRRRMAYANFRRHALPDDPNASMALAIVSQSLINYHSPPKMARILEAMSSDGTIQFVTDQLSDEDMDGQPLTTTKLRLPEHYQLVSRISIGGMGAIYKGRHKGTNAMVAIKILHPHVAAKENNLQRFEREAQAASKLKHPNLVVVHDYGVTPDEVPYLVMELIEGKTLREEFGKGGLAPQRFFAIFQQVCDALDHAHRKGVIHRDIKPSNILLTRSDEGNDFVKVVDFGIAKVVASQDLGSQELTQTGDLIGSPLYMSPEQCMGEVLDARTDIYSLGCVMYEAITGQPPLTAENAVKTIFKHINVRPEPISVVRPEIRLPVLVEQMIFKALEKDPRNRFASMADLRQAINQCRTAMSL